MQPGDIVFAHSNGFAGRLIRFGERLRWKRGSVWNHAAVISRIEDGVAYVIQADIRGVNEAPLSSVGSYITMEPPQGCDRVAVLQFAQAQVAAKARYSLGSILSIAFDIITPNWFPEVRRDNTWICSALVAEALRFGGWLHCWGSVYCVTPAELFDALH
jgi:hypothetical protein